LEANPVIHDRHGRARIASRRRDPEDARLSPRYRIGIDVGGTFTDLVAVDEHGALAIAKCASTPPDPSEGLIAGLELLAAELGTSLRDLLARTDSIVHGTTVATNALLERKGATTGLLTTEGHRDVIEMREGLKDDRYNIRMAPPVPLVPRARRLGVRERLRFDGTVAIPLSVRSLRAAMAALARARVEAVAVCYLHSYRNPRHEKLTGRELARRFPGVYVSLSADVLPQIKEFERVWTTVVNAYVGPALARYLTSLAGRLTSHGYRGEVLIMQSHGGVAPVRESTRLAAGAVLSGPAGGVAAGRYSARLLNEPNLITFDMGGTSTDIALLQGGEPQLTGEKTVGVAKVALPAIDIHTLGAGGGSVAWVDAGRILHVGPESAGAEPGPACYGKGGTRATVTDANLVLGFLDPGNFLGGRIGLDTRAARAAVDRIAKELGTTPLRAADGIARVVNTNMAEGIKIVSVRRGVDPRQFALVAFGGAAGLHVTEVARLLEIRRVVVPSVAAVLSAWGMLATDLRYELVRSHVSEVGRMTAPGLRRLFAALEREGRKRLARFDGPISVRRGLDMRYGEQIFEIQVDLDGVDLQAADLLDQVADRFHRRHEELYAYSAQGQEVVIVNARVAVVGELPVLPASAGAVEPGPARSAARRRVWLGDWVEVAVHRMETVVPGQEFKGPAIFESATTTVLVREGERVAVTPNGWLDIRLG
jgi:N-methylhydantoinase A